MCFGHELTLLFQYPLRRVVNVALKSVRDNYLQSNLLAHALPFTLCPTFAITFSSFLFLPFPCVAPHSHQAPVSSSHTSHHTTPYARIPSGLTRALYYHRSPSVPDSLNDALRLHNLQPRILCRPQPWNRGIYI